MKPSCLGPFGPVCLLNDAVKLRPGNGLSVQCEAYCTMLARLIRVTLPVIDDTDHFPGSSVKNCGADAIPDHEACGVLGLLTGLGSIGDHFGGGHMQAHFVSCCSACSIAQNMPRVSSPHCLKGL